MNDADARLNRRDSGYDGAVGRLGDAASDTYYNTRRQQVSVFEAKYWWHVENNQGPNGECSPCIVFRRMTDALARSLRCPLVDRSARKGR